MECSQSLCSARPRASCDVAAGPHHGSLETGLRGVVRTGGGAGGRVAMAVSGVVAGSGCRVAASRVCGVWLYHGRQSCDIKDATPGAAAASQGRAR